MSFDDWTANVDDFKRLATLAKVDFSVSEEDEAPDEEEPALDLDSFLEDLAKAAISPDPNEFTDFVAKNQDDVLEALAQDPSVEDVLLAGYRVGIAFGSDACMNALGAHYYLGDIFEQDFAKAKELYQMAVDHGNLQSLINLGYIYEYGRTGKPDFQKAYEYYSLAAALTPSFEAAYKLGDMYARGKGVGRDMRRAHMLWERSLDLSQNVVERAQPAIRIAQLLVDPECERWGIDADPLRALKLFQDAEVGLRIDIADGQYYYKKRLREAIEGQEVARALLEEEDSDLDF
ncbi:tetratricopeptide repeat protein [Parafannyhessea sp. LCP21S3_E6]|uniref:tetratricopeptide repeat protein n=1 Tax=unclassified Parafannyhessea TaxID=2847323 RepID=UPI003F96CBA0